MGKEKSKPSGQLEFSADHFNSSVARLTSNSIGELQGLVSELQKMQEFLTSEVTSVQRQIDSALGGINIIVETIGPWKSIASSQTLPPGARNVRTGGLAAILSNAIASGSNGRDAPLSGFAGSREHVHPPHGPGERSTKKANRNAQTVAEFPNMAQRAVVQFLSLDDWKVAACLPIPAGELMLSRIRNYGWIEIRGKSTIRQSSSPRRGSRRCGRPFETSRLVELERRRRNDITGRKNRCTIPQKLTNFRAEPPSVDRPIAEKAASDAVVSEPAGEEANATRVDDQPTSASQGTMAEQTSSPWAGLDLDTAIRLRWALRDIKAKRTKLTPVSPSDLKTLLEMGLIEMRDDAPLLTNEGHQALD